MRLLMLSFLLLLSCIVGLAQDTPPENARPSQDSIGPAEDIAAVAAVVDAFNKALNEGDNAAALALLAPDSMFLEGGGLETYAEYRDNHLPADIEFEDQVDGVRDFMRVTVNGNSAWVITTHFYDGKFDGREISFELATLSVLSRESNGWKFRAIHWSSR